MKIDLMPWMLLIFGASLSSGHYIHQADANQSPEDSNVYAVKDGSSGITFVNPKAEKPTVREILYYHVIERERGKHAVTERSFTNSHGYQFSEHPSSDEQDLPYDEEEDDDEYLQNEEPEENDHEEADDYLRAIIKDQDTENHDDEEPESSSKPGQLTNEDVKEAYKARSYLFDQMRQRYAVKRMVDSLHRKKRNAELEPLPDAPKLSNDEDKAARMQPNTYGMNIKPEGGYVWNNLNKPPSYYELGASNGNPNEGQVESLSQENLPPGENTYSPTEQQSNTDNSEATDESPEPNDDAYDLSDICVDINKPCALPLGNVQAANANPEDLESNDSGTNPFEPVINSNESSDNESGEGSESDDGVPNYPTGSVAFENPEPVVSEANNQPDAPNTYGMSLTSDGGHVWNDLVNPPVSYEVGSNNENPEPNNSEATYPLEPIIGGEVSNNDSESNDGAAAYPMETEISENPELLTNPVPNESGAEESEMPQTENPISEGVAEPAGSTENTGSGYEESQQEELRPESSPEESSEGEKLMEIPEAPTLAPLNYDNLQGYINGATDGPASYEQTDNSYMNPQVYPEDTKAKEENMESILVTMQPVEDIPQTYGMNLTSDGGHVWNTLVNPPVSYDIGSSNENPEPINQNPKPNDIEANSPAKPAVVDDTSNSDSESNEGATYPQGSEATENPEPSYPIEAVAENPGTMESDVNIQPDVPNTYGMNLNPDGGHVWNTMVNPAVSYDIGSSNEHSESVNENNNSEHVGESSESYGFGNQGSQSEEQKPENTPEESSEGEKPKEPIWSIPEAPTLPPLNYDNLPDYIRNSLSSTEKPGHYEHTENPYTNPQTDPDDKKTMEDKMEDIFATMKPAEDVPNKTYGMSLNPDGGHVWNDMVNPPISYDVGSPSASEEEHKKEPASAPESNEQPGSHESEEAKNPIQEPAEPEKEEGLEEPIANQENPEPKPHIPETEDSKPIEEPAQQVEPMGPETAEMEEPEVAEPSQENQEEQNVEPVEPKPEEGNAKPDIMNELLKSEQFWKWLGIWTATYMELLEKHIRKIAIQEICNHQKIGNQMCLIDEYSEDSGVIMKDEKIVVDDKEMDLTHTDNLDKELKRGDHNQNNHNKGTNGNKIEASTIYGNSVGNEKVTNVYIFTADKADEVIDKLKPKNDSEIDFIIDERIKEEKNKDENKTPDEEASKVEVNKDEANNEALNKEESNEGDVNAEESNNEEANKEESSVSEAIEEDLNKETTNKDELNEDNENSEELSNEEVNKEESIEIEPNMDDSNTEYANKEGNNGEIEKQEANIEESLEGETNNEDEANKKEPTESEPNEEELNEKEVNKEAAIQSDSNKEDLNKEVANKDESKEGKAKEEELNEEEANKEESKEGETSEEELNEERTNKGEANDEKLNKEENNKKEPNESQMNEEELNKKDENKEESIDSEANEDIKEASKKESDKGATNEEELNKEEAKEDEMNQESNKNKDSKLEADVDNLNKDS